MTRFERGLGVSLILAMSLLANRKAVAMDPRDSASPFGVLTFLDWDHDWNDHMYNTPLKMDHAVRLIQESGAGFVRQAISWDEVEAEQGKFDFSKYDAILDNLEGHNLRVLGILCYTAEWTGQHWNTPPDTRLFSNYVRKTVERYKGRIKYWELWNEPDQKTYWADQDSMKTYTALLKTVYSLIKEIDPTAVVVLGSVNTPFPLRDIYREGGKGFFDVVNIHPFVSPIKPEPLVKLKAIYTGTRKVMAEFQDENRDIWITEIGCPGIANGNTSVGWWEGKSPNDQEQATWVTQIYGEALQWPGVKKIFWAFFQESKHFGNDIDTFGLIKRDFDTKPAYEAYQRAAKSWEAVSR
jgi:hypothetical protein